MSRETFDPVELERVVRLALPHVVYQSHGDGRLRCDVLRAYHIDAIVKAILEENCNSKGAAL